MSILADLARLSRRIQAILDQALGDIDTAGDTFSDDVTHAILRLLDDFDLDALAALDLDAVIEEALAEAFDDLDDELRTVTSARLKELIDETDAFYKQRGIEAPGAAEAVRRSQEARAISQVFDASMNVRREKLQEEATEALTEAIAAGEINRTALAERVAERAEVSMGLARTQVDTSLSAYNQAYRNQLAEDAGLGHFLYYGSITDRSRVFCRERADKVYTSEQIDAMDNGMLNPVRIFRGGFNCRHSLLAIDIAWSKELADKLVDT